MARIWLVVIGLLCCLACVSLSLSQDDSGTAGVPESGFGCKRLVSLFVQGVLSQSVL